MNLFHIASRWVYKVLFFYNSILLDTLMKVKNFIIFYFKRRPPFCLHDHDQSRFFLRYYNVELKTSKKINNKIPLYLMIFRSDYITIFNFISYYIQCRVNIYRIFLSTTNLWPHQTTFGRPLLYTYSICYWYSNLID